jgi:hypothetical protein
MERDLKYLCEVIVVAMMLFWTDVSGQAKVRKMSRTINHPSLNVFAPYISADANAVVFLSDNAEDHALTAFYSHRKQADWQEPQLLPKLVNTRLNFLRGYGLSADGSTLYFSTIKSPGVGGFDIWTSEWRGGNAWTNPVNLGAPINSKMDEACASLTPDGRTMYFMRCAKMDQNTAAGCSLYRVDKKSNGLWGEPAELPSHINTGNSQTPRIMADSETLIFSSDVMEDSKGGMDLFVTRFRDGNWTAPIPMHFANTERDDQYVSVAALGRYLLRDSPGDRKSEIVEYLIPDNLRPKGMMKIDGSVVDESGQPLPAYISLINSETGERVYSGRPESDGTFLLYAMEGSLYELAVDPEHGNRTYYSKILDLRVDPIPQIEKVQAVLKTVSPGDELMLDGIRFEEYSANIDLTFSQRELQRFARIVTSNPQLKFEIQVNLEGYEEDSVRSHPDLTEMRIDTVHWLYIDIDTLGQLYERDTASLKIVFHNDRTVEQARRIIEFLISKGAAEGNVNGSASAAAAILPEEKKLMVRARVVKM